MPSWNDRRHSALLKRVTPDLPQIPDAAQRKWALGYEDIDAELEAAAGEAIKAAAKQLRDAHLAEMGARVDDRGDEGVRAPQAIYD
jgi:hypothetical protein